MRHGLDQQYKAVASGHWPLIRYDPMVRAGGGNPFLLDSPRPRISLGDYRKEELRFRALTNTDPPEPNACRPSPSRRSISAGSSTRRWPDAAPAISRPTPARITDGAGNQLQGP